MDDLLWLYAGYNSFSSDIEGFATPSTAALPQRAQGASQNDVTVLRYMRDRL